MRTMTAEFKCRRCGAVVDGGVTGLSESLAYKMTFETINGKSSQVLQPLMVEMHTCKPDNGNCADNPNMVGPGVGVTDFIGWRFNVKDQDA